MLVPRFVHGLTRDVKKESVRRIRLFKKGATWADAMADDLVDLSMLPGALVLEGPYAKLGSEPHTHLYSPFHWADHAMWEHKRTLPLTALSQIFFEAVKTRWGVLGMVGNSNWVIPESHRWPFIRAVVREWGDLTELSEGGFTGGAKKVWPPWPLSAAAYYAFCDLGLPKEDFYAYPPESFHALYRRLLEVRAAQGLPPPPEEG
ncbi:hypothetical protein L6R46_31045 [Myxococcota bacterium]|jgi:hypothetical protein|nr:hypothetical protein [Myxococcota bacterium]